MLWYKGWLETRLKLLFSLALMVFWLYVLRGFGNASPKIVVYLASTVSVFALTWSMLLSGAGITTQPPFQGTKGLHGSMIFTLSLPVSRFRLLAVRAFIGWLETAGCIGLFCCGMWLFYPALRAMMMPAEMLAYAATLVACITWFYCLSVLLATFLEDQWRVWGSMLAGAGFWWLSKHVSMPAATDLLRAMGKGSPLIAHAMPWPANAFSLALSAAFLGAALIVVRTREY
jgi:hypothetical protein